MAAVICLDGPSPIVNIRPSISLTTLTARDGAGHAVRARHGLVRSEGLASIVLGLIYVDRASNLPGESTIRLAVTATVLLSIFLHGLTAMPGIRRYARVVAALGPEAPEHRGREVRSARGPA